MHLTLRCPDCDSALPVLAAEAPAEVTCGRCGRAIPLSVSDDLRADRKVDTCPVCAGPDFYIRKDFDPTLGVTVVVIGGLTTSTLITLVIMPVIYMMLEERAEKAAERRQARIDLHPQPASGD